MVDGWRNGKVETSAGLGCKTTLYSLLHSMTKMGARFFNGGVRECMIV